MPLSNKSKKRIINYIIDAESSHKGLYEDCFEHCFGVETEYNRELEEEVHQFLVSAQQAVNDWIDAKPNDTNKDHRDCKTNGSEIGVQIQPDEKSETQWC